MSNVIVKENETLDSALRRFKRNCAKAGIQQEIRKREHYENPALDVRKSLKLRESVSTIKLHKSEVLSRKIEDFFLWSLHRLY